MSIGKIAALVIGGLLVGVVSVVGEEPLPKGSALPVKNAKFHRFEKLRAGRIKTERGWNVIDFGISMFNPSLNKTIKVTWALIADDPHFIYKDGRKGKWTKDFTLGPDNGTTDNVYCGTYPGVQWPVPAETNWTGVVEFSSDEPFCAYILLTPEMNGPDLSTAIKKGWLVWSDEVQGNWDEDRKQIIFPYTNYWQNDPNWLGGWHTRLILVNRSEAPVVYKVSHRPYYWRCYSAFNNMKDVPFTEQSFDVNLAAGESRAVWLEDLFGWGKDSSEAMEGRLCVTPSPGSAREKCEVKLYILPDKVSVESLKEAEKKALSEDAGVVVSVGRR